MDLKKKLPDLEPPPPVRYRYNLGPDMMETLHRAFNIVSKKGAKKKHNEVDEMDVPVLIRALGYNPTEEQIELVLQRARDAEDPKECTKGHVDMDNLQNKIADLLVSDPSLAYRHTEQELIAALRVLSPPGQDYIEPNDLYNAMTKLSNTSHDEVMLMIRDSKDKDTGKVWHEDYAFLASSNSIPNPPNIIATELPPEPPPDQQQQQQQQPGKR